MTRPHDWSTSAHRNLPGAKTAHGIPSLRPSVICTVCGTKTKESGKTARSAGQCSHLIANYDHAMSPCDCPPSHMFCGIKCRIVTQLISVPSTHPYRYFQCVDCKLRWRMNTPAGWGHTLDHVYSPRQRVVELSD